MLGHGLLDEILDSGALCLEPGELMPIVLTLELKLLSAVERWKNGAVKFSPYWDSSHSPNGIPLPSIRSPTNSTNPQSTGWLGSLWKLGSGTGAWVRARWMCGASWRKPISSGRSPPWRLNVEPLVGAMSFHLWGGWNHCSTLPQNASEHPV